MFRAWTCRGRESQLIVSCQLMTNPCCSSAVIFWDIFPHLTGQETINIPKIFSGVHGLKKNQRDPFHWVIWIYNLDLPDTHDLETVLCVNVLNNLMLQKTLHSVSKPVFHVQKHVGGAVEPGPVHALKNETVCLIECLKHETTQRKVGCSW